MPYGHYTRTFDMKTGKNAGSRNGFKKGNTAGYIKGILHGPVSDSTRAKMRIAAKKRMQSPDIRAKVRKWVIEHPLKRFMNTKIEQLVAKELTRRKIKFNQNFGLATIKNVDFYLPTLRIVIECDGCYWHRCEYYGFQDKFDVRKKDALNTKKLENAGFIVYKIWEHSINSSVRQCINKIIN